jgi:CheY-like chemotaxis protein
MVVGCSSREQALTQLGKLHEHPDLILTDYRLAGGETGADVIRAIRALTRKQAPAIILTGEIVGDSPGADLPTRDAVAIGDVVVMRKPVRAVSLMRAIQELTTKSEPYGAIRQPVLCAGD